MQLIKILSRKCCTVTQDPEAHAKKAIGTDSYGLCPIHTTVCYWLQEINVIISRQLVYGEIYAYTAK